MNPHATYLSVLLILVSLSTAQAQFQVGLRGDPDADHGHGLAQHVDCDYLSFEDWQYASVNNMPLDVQRASYEALTIPESKTVGRAP